jgi:hypothetical protein
MLQTQVPPPEAEQLLPDVMAKIPGVGEPQEPISDEMRRELASASPSEGTGISGTTTPPDDSSDHAAANT